jgi:DNA invertase Pin-like site-specific DNA recombinase
MARAHGYVRQSVASTTEDDQNVSVREQMAAIARLARADGIEPDAVVVHQDIGRSGAAGKESRRKGYQELVSAIERGQVDVVYGLSLSRLARSVAETLRFFELCRLRGVRVVLANNPGLDPTQPMGAFLLTVLAAVNALEVEIAREHTLAVSQMKREAGVAMGRAPYGWRFDREARGLVKHEGEDPDAVVAAFTGTGSFNGAARNLNVAGVPTRLGRPWNGSSVRSVLTHYRPEILPEAGRARGARAGADARFAFYRLLVCRACGSRLTGSDKSSKGSRTPHISYRCHTRDADPNHPLPRSIREPVLFRWVEAEFERYFLPADLTKTSMEEVVAERTALVERRARVIDSYELGHITREAYLGRMEDIDQRLASLSPAMEVMPPPGEFGKLLDWADVKRVNWLLRELIASIECDYVVVDGRVEFRPAAVAWRVPRTYLVNVFEEVAPTIKETVRTRYEEALEREVGQEVERMDVEDGLTRKRPVRATLVRKKLRRKAGPDD